MCQSHITNHFIAIGEVVVQFLPASWFTIILKWLFESGTFALGIGSVRSHFSILFLLGRIDSVTEGYAELTAHNRFFPDEPLELISPGMGNCPLEITGLSNLEGDTLDVAQPNQRVRFASPPGVRTGDLLRRTSEEPCDEKGAL